jgi:glycosyltransferase involved in cell wall biosynthesis
MDTNKIYILNFTSLETGGGDAVCAKKLVNQIKNLFAITFTNPNEVPLHPKEINLRAKTHYNEILWITPKIMTLFIKTIRSANVFHLNAFNFSDIIIAIFLKVLRKRFIFQMHGNIYFRFKSVTRLLENLRLIFVDNVLVVLADRIVFITEAQGKQFQRYCFFPGTLAHKSRVIHNAIEPEIIRSQQSNNSGTFKVIYVGRLEETKGIHDLLRLAKKLEDSGIFFIIVGSGGNYHYPDHQPSNVSFVGNIPNRKLMSYYDQAQIFLLPSYSESFGIVVLEAMARGLVILASDLPCLREYLQEGVNGFFFPAGDIETMKQRILYIKDNSELRQEISGNNLRDVRRFTVVQQAELFQKLYGELLHKEEG